MNTIKFKGATVSVPGPSELPKAEDERTNIVMDTMQTMLLKLALYQCRADWETRLERQRQGIARVEVEDNPEATGRAQEPRPQG